MNSAVRIFETSTGLPAVVVPVMGASSELTLAGVAQAAAAGPDVIEWRLDSLVSASGTHDAQGALDLLPRVIETAAGVRVLATFRSHAEGGPGELADEPYGVLLRSLATSGLVHGIDCELSRPEPAVRDAITLARAAGVAVIGSSHHFDRTPESSELDEIFAALAQRRSQVLKVATMPHDVADVWRLLAAARRAQVELGLAVLPIAMGSLGVITRIAGESFGSPATFGSVGKGSAPGQVEIGALRSQLAAFHTSLTGQGS